jgi:hypothetical protein
VAKSRPYRERKFTKTIARQKSVLSPKLQFAASLPVADFGRSSLNNSYFNAETDPQESG